MNGFRGEVKKVHYVVLAAILVLLVMAVYSIFNDRGGSFDSIRFAPLTKEDLRKEAGKVCEKNGNVINWWWTLTDLEDKMETQAANYCKQKVCKDGVISPSGLKFEDFAFDPATCELIKKITVDCPAGVVSGSKDSVGSDCVYNHRALFPICRCCSALGGLWYNENLGKQVCNDKCKGKSGEVAPKCCKIDDAVFSSGKNKLVCP